MSFPAVVSKPPPGRGWYVVAGLLLIATAAAMALFIYSRISGLAAELVQVVVPGQADLNLRETGTYTIFHEYRSVVDDKVYYAASLSGMHMTVRSPSGTPAEPRFADGDEPLFLQRPGGRLDPRVRRDRARRSSPDRVV